MMSKIASMLMELKDTSEMMIDLAYSSLLYDNTEIAEEVIALSDNLESLSERIQDEIAQAHDSGGHEDLIGDDEVERQHGLVPALGLVCHAVL